MQKCMKRKNMAFADGPRKLEQDGPERLKRLELEGRGELELEEAIRAGRIARRQMGIPVAQQGLERANRKKTPAAAKP
jgi:hypothetical protein